MFVIQDCDGSHESTEQLLSQCEFLNGAMICYDFGVRQIRPCVDKKEPHVEVDDSSMDHLIHES